MPGLRAFQTSGIMEVPLQQTGWRGKTTTGDVDNQYGSVGICTWSAMACAFYFYLCPSCSKKIFTQHFTSLWIKTVNYNVRGRKTAEWRRNEVWN